MIRILARRIVFEGREHKLSLLEISADGRQVKISPFVKETHSTVFIDGAVEVIHTGQGYSYRCI